MMVNVIVSSKLFYFFSIWTEHPALGQIKTITSKAWLVVGIMLFFSASPNLRAISACFPRYGNQFRRVVPVLVFSCLIVLVTDFDRWLRLRKEDRNG